MTSLLLTDDRAAAGLPPDGRPGLTYGHDRVTPLPALGADELVELVRAAGLGGRGGAGFPTWRKLAAVAAAAGRPGRAVVVANGAEGEPASGKDAWLLAHRPHLVLDGLSLAASALRAGEVHLYVGATGLVPHLQRLADARLPAGGPAVRVVAAPPTFLAGEETAALGWLAGRAAAPRSRPPLVAERGLHGRPTLVQNVETLAQLALVVRDGSAAYRARGTEAEPGTLLVTVSGAVARPGVAELEHGAPLADALRAAGGATAALSAVLVGGYHGGWVAAADLPSATLSRPGLAALGSSLGAGVVVALDRAVCGLVETARVLRYLAAESAGQCGPCLNGLPRLAGLMGELAGGRMAPQGVAELRRVAGLVDGRGACRHPDGTVRLLRSALLAFPAEVESHLAGRCTATDHAAVLPTSGSPA